MHKNAMPSAPPHIKLLLMRLEAETQRFIPEQENACIHIRIKFHYGIYTILIKNS